MSTSLPIAVSFLQLHAVVDNNMNEQDDKVYEKLDKNSPEAVLKDRESGENVDNEVYELQLTQLQQQLIAAMIENEDLKTELDQFKEKNKVDQIFQELEYERERNRQLRVQLMQREVPRDVSPPSSDSSPEPVTGKSFGVKLCNYFIELYFDFIADFSDEGECNQHFIAEQESEQLSVKQLKDNIKRFKKGVGPILDMGRNLMALLTWQSPALSLLALVVYLYCVWQGWLLTLALVLCLLQFTINYLVSRGWQIHFGVFCSPSAACSKDSEVPELALSDKFNLVLQVARQVQVVLGRLADGLEKTKKQVLGYLFLNDGNIFQCMLFKVLGKFSYNLASSCLLMWRHAEASRRLFIEFIVMLLLSCILSGVTLFKVFAFYIGVKMFIVDYLYKRFPRFKQRHDSWDRTWKQLPTDAMLIDTSKFEGCNVRKQPNNHSVEISDADKTFCATFTLPLSEKPLFGWEGGWRVTLVERDKPFIKAFSRSGRLYLTNSFLCFERFRTQSSKNIMIPLNNITRIDKVAKPFSWLPGTGMSIQISVAGYEQPYTFGAIVGRDDCLNQIVQHGVRLRLAWATEHSSTMTHPTDSPSAAQRPVVRDLTPTTEQLSSSPRDAVDDNFVFVSG